MPNNKKLTIKTAAKPALVISRPAFVAEKLVYVAVANKALNYPHGKSCIAYIGTTESGAKRIAESAAKRAQDLLALHSVTSLSFFVVTCSPRKGVKSWRKLEVGLILAFKYLYGTVPRCNTVGKTQAWSDELEYFTRSRLETILKKYE
jgi:hypothetical protein